MLRDLEDARARLAHFVAHYNFQRPHQSLEGLTPADRFFGAERAVREAMERAIQKNVLRLAIGETPRKPVYLVGQIDGQSVSVHGEGGKVVVQTSEGVRQEIEARDLGAPPLPTPPAKPDPEPGEEASGGCETAAPKEGPGGGAAAAARAPAETGEAS